MPRAQHRKGRPNLPILTASAVIRELLTILIQQKLSYQTIAKRAGFGQNAPGRWARGFGAPNILTAEALAEVLGYEIVLRKKTNDQSLAPETEIENSNLCRETSVEPRKSARPSTNLFKRTARGKNGQFVRWDV